MTESTQILSHEFLAPYKTKQPNWGYGGLGFVVYKRTYSRLKADGTSEDWWETVQRCVEGAQKIGAQYTREEAESLYDKVFNLKCNFAGRMLWQLGTTTVDRFGANSLLNCFAGETEILTSDGIKPIASLVGTSPEVMTAYGKWVEAEVKAFGEQRLYQIELSKGKAKKTVYATKEHRWFRRSYKKADERSSASVEVTTETLMTGDNLVSTYGQSVRGIDGPSLYGIAHGLIYGDGSVCCNVGQIRLCGDKNAELIKYFPGLKTYDYEGDVIVSGLPKYFKAAPTLDMDKPYLYGWLAGYFAADGSIKEEGQIRLASASRGNLELARDVCVKLGIGYSSITTQERIGIGQTEESTLYTLGINGLDLTEDFFLISEHRKRFTAHHYVAKFDWKVVSVKPTERVETVYCAVVPETHSFVLEGNILTGNCWYVSVNELRAFEFIFENLMLGGGVGFSIRKEDVHELPRVKEGVKVTALTTKDADFIVPDSREGWVKLLHEVLQAFFVTGKSFSFSTVLIRGAGETIRGFGGTASGPNILVEGMAKIATIVSAREGKKLRSIDVLDICNIIGSVVVAGNVRRSAQIALGDPDDHHFIRAKNWSLGNVPNWRAMSNNTIYADSFSHISNDLWDNGFSVNPETGFARGEPYGFFNLPLSQKYGRTKDGLMRDEKMYVGPKDNCLGTNPCAEISLASYECCNLSELYLNNITSEKELIECATLLYKTQKAICALPFLHPETEDIVYKNMRIGLGVTGVCQSLDKVPWLDACYRELRRLDREWSKKRGWAQSIKLTTVKPSGTLSLLAGSTPGVHPAFSQYYIRRVRMGSGDKLVKICRDLGYHVEYVIGFDGKEDHTTVVIEFPCESGANAILTKDMSAIKQLELVKTLQSEWADNAVSVTVYYKPEELSGIKEWLAANYEKNIKSVSFLLYSKHGFKQAPYQEITEQEYRTLKAGVKPLSMVAVEAGEMLSDVIDCSTGACPIR